MAVKFNKTTDTIIPKCLDRAESKEALKAASAQLRAQGLIGERSVYLIKWGTGWAVVVRDLTK